MTKPYQAIIEGQERTVNGFDEQSNLILDNGQRYAFERLNFNPSGQAPDEPEGDIFNWQLLEVVKLQQWQGDWQWNDETQLLSQWLAATGQNKKSATLRIARTAKEFNRRIMRSRLNELPPRIQEQVRAVAWFKHDDGADGWDKPILLKSFRSLSPNASPKVEAVKFTPDYFTITTAAKYAKKSERTIRNWIKNEWLKVEKNKTGKKIRITKVELDKSINKQ